MTKSDIKEGDTVVLHSQGGEKTRTVQSTDTDYLFLESEGEKLGLVTTNWNYESIEGTHHLHKQ